MEFKHKVRVDSREEFLRKYIDIFCAVGIDEKFRLCKKEREFYIKCIMLYNQGIDLLSKEARTVLEEAHAHTKDPAQSVYQYRLKLKNKGWLIQDNGTLRILPIFEFIKQPDPNHIDFNLNVIYAN